MKVKPKVLKINFVEPGLNEFSIEQQIWRIKRILQRQLAVTNHG